MDNIRGSVVKGKTTSASVSPQNSTKFIIRFIISPICCFPDISNKSSVWNHYLVIFEWETLVLHGSQFSPIKRRRHDLNITLRTPPLSGHVLSLSFVKLVSRITLLFQSKVFEWRRIKVPKIWIHILTSHYVVHSDEHKWLQWVVKLVPNVGTTSMPVMADITTYDRHTFAFSVRFVICFGRGLSCLIPCHFVPARQVVIQDTCTNSNYWLIDYHISRL